MPRIKNTDLQKHTLNLRRGDYEKMDELFPTKRGGPAIRALISMFVDKHINSKTALVEIEPDETEL